METMADKKEKKKGQTGEDKWKERVDFRHNLKTYYNFVKKYKLLYLIIFVSLTVVELARLGERYLFKVIIDSGTSFSAGDVIVSAFIQVLLGVILAYALLVGTRLIFSFIEFQLVNRLEANIIFDIKSKFFSHILHLSHNFHTTHKTGSLISKLSRGSRAVERITDFMFFDFGPVIIQIIAVSTAIFYFDVASSITVLLTAGAFVCYSVIMSYIQQTPTLNANNAEDLEKGNLADFLMNVDSVKYFGKENVIIGKYRQLAENTKNLFIKLWDYGTWFSIGQTIILGFGTFFLLYFPLRALINGQMTIGTIAFIYTAYLGLLSPLYGVVYSIRRVYESMADFQALFNYDKIKNDIVDKENAPDLHVKRGEIELRDVSFKYRSRNVLDSTNLKIKPGEKVALVGRSGSGKTTLVKLLFRFYDVNSGEIIIDGTNTRDVKQVSLRSELSIVPQECILFDDTIYNNILFSNPKAKREEVMKAIKLAQLEDFVRNLPEKEDTVVGERGVKLSGGEKQRVSIARALLANKRILVLDEATSSLDSKTEYEIQRELEHLMKGRTSLIIAHRLSTIMKADKIVVLDKGKIVQVGKHRELISRKGIYKELWSLQKGGYLGE